MPNSEKRYFIVVPERLFQDLAHGCTEQAKLLRNLARGALDTQDGTLPAPGYFMTEASKDFNERAGMLDRLAENLQELEACDAVSLSEAAATFKKGTCPLAKIL